MIKSQTKNQQLLNKFGVDSSKFLGKGRESSTFALDSERVIKIFVSGNVEYLEKLSDFYYNLSHHNLPYQTPLILLADDFNGLVYSIEKRLEGRELDQIFSKLSEEQRFKALKNYFEAFSFYNQISFSDNQFGQIISTTKSIRTDAWSEYLQRKLKQKLTTQPKLAHDITNLDEKVEILERFIQNKFNNQIKKSLVHADYYFTNVLMSENIEISAVLDFGEHAVVGDCRMDVAAAVDFLNINPFVTSKMKTYVKNLAREKYGIDIDLFIAFYALFYKFYFADTKDEGLYDWSIQGLNEEELWDLLD